jgi:hypothetical protein
MKEVRKVRRYWKISLILFIFISSIVILAVTSSSQQHMMRGMMGNWDNMMTDCNRWMTDWDNMMSKKDWPGTMGMMGMRGMGMNVYQISWNMKRMMDDLNYILNDDEMMSDQIVKQNAEEMQQQIDSMSNQVQNIMESMQEITDRLQKEK